MTNVKHTNVFEGDVFDLFASNYSKANYGFAGWSFDPNAQPGGASRIYGPNEAITAPAASTPGETKTLYAIWVQSAGNLQNWQGCASMSSGAITALKDTRDNNVYTVGKLADGNCWMMENLRLDTANSSDSTKAQGFGGAFVGLADPETTFGGTTANSLYNTTNITGDYQSYRFPRYNNTNTSTRATNPNVTDNRSAAISAHDVDLDTNIYSYGNYYTWAAAMANTENFGDKSKSELANTSICPSGWKLPYGDAGGKGNASGGFYYLGTQLGATTPNEASSRIWRTYPNNFIYSSLRGVQGTYPSSSSYTDYSRESTYGLLVNKAWLYAGSGNIPSKNAYFSVRCIVAKGLEITLMSNDGTGKVNGRVYGEAGSSVGLPTFVRDGYRFSWNTAADGSGTSYTGSYTLGSTGITLYAQWVPAYTIQYDGNGADAGVMTNVKHTNVKENDVFDLFASNYSKANHGFAGWSFDSNAQPGGASRIYGPNEAITAPASTTPGETKTLYAVWVQSAGNLQDWQGCASMSAGAVTALKDTRDNQVYTVGKLADGNCWMMENLRLDTAGSSDSTKAQGFGGAFVGLADPETANFSNVTTANTLNGNTLYSTANITGNNQGYRFPRYNNTNTSARATSPSVTDNRATATSAHTISLTTATYSYGNYYTWVAALANTNDYNSPTATVDGKTSEAAGTSICPSGWKLPYGRNTGNGNASGGFYYLGTQLEATTSNATSSQIWRSYPNNFLYSGYIESNTLYNRGANGYYWSSTTYSSNYSYSLYMSATSIDPGPSYSHTKSSGRPVRCVNSSSSNITLNKNGGTGGSDSTVVAHNATTLSTITNPTKASTTYTLSGFSKTASATNASVSSTANKTSTQTYTFNGWHQTSASDSALIASNSTTPVLQANTDYTDANGKWTHDGDVTLYAGWTANGYSSVTLPTITRTGSTCGWSTTNGATTWEYNSGSAIVPSSNMTLYGVCRNNITLNGNGASTEGSTSATVEYNATALSTITLPQKSYTVSGFTKPTGNNADGATVSSTSTLTSNYTFNGWYKESAATNKVAGNTTTPALEPSTTYTNSSSQWTYTTASSLTFYAGWSGGTITLPTITKSGYTCGWTETATGATTIQYLSGSSITPDTNKTLYGVCVTALTVNFEGNSLEFADGSTSNTVLYHNDCGTKYVSAPEYSHTSNINDDGTQIGTTTYDNNLATKDVITIPNADSLHVTLTYGTEENYDYVYVFTGEYTGNVTKNMQAGQLATYVGGKNTTTTVTLDISGDTATFAFFSDTSQAYYGYHAKVEGYYNTQPASYDHTTEACVKTLAGGEYKTPVDTPHKKFTGWSESSTATTPTYTSAEDVRQNLSGGNGETKTLYAVYDNYYVITFVNTDTGATQTKQVKYGSSGTITPSTTWSRTNYSLAGWDTNSAGTNVVYTKGQSVTPTSDITVYTVWKPAYTLVYDGNGADEGVMTNVKHTNVYEGDVFDLYASNYSKAGYGFAGWSFDQNAQPGGASRIYGPNEAITAPAPTNPGQAETKTLYAVWVQSAGNLQNWNGCASMSAGAVTALKDTRDNQVYTVGKLADGNCWMMENLRLDTANSADSTKAQGFGGAFVGLADSETTNFSNSTTANTLNGNTLYSTTNITGNNQGYRFPRYNNTNTSARSANPNTTDNRSTATSAHSWSLSAAIYSYGNYYTWAAAMANTEDLTTSSASESANTSICPKGWQLPYGRITGNGNTSGGFYYLGAQLGATTSSTASSRIWRSYPNNFVYSGSYNGSSFSSRGSYIDDWSSTANGTSAYTLNIYTTGGGAAGSISKVNGYSVRCVIKREAILDTGQNVGQKLKRLAGNSSATYTTQDTAITAFVRSDTLPNGFAPTTENTISHSSSPFPIYAWYNSTNATIYYYSEVTNITMNNNSSSFFRQMRALSNLSTISTWDTSRVTDMSYMFYYAGHDVTSSFNLNLSTWDTSSVASMYSMFYSAAYNASSFTLNLSTWNTSNVTNMGQMFYGAGYSAATWSVIIPKTNNGTASGPIANTASYLYGSTTSDVASAPWTDRPFTLAN